MKKDKRDHDILRENLVVLPTDYTDYGGKVKRWDILDAHYPDCSVGCKFARKLEGTLGNDWVVCVNPNSPRVGLLTFEHQAGFDCFEEDEALIEEDELRD